MPLNNSKSAACQSRATQTCGLSPHLQTTRYPIPSQEPQSSVRGSSSIRKLESDTEGSDAVPDTQNITYSKSSKTAQGNALKTFDINCDGTLKIFSSSQDGRKDKTDKPNTEQRTDVMVHIATVPLASPMSANWF